jgi:hypothetical protein
MPSNIEEHFIWFFPCEKIGCNARKSWMNDPLKDWGKQTFFHSLKSVIFKKKKGIPNIIFSSSSDQKQEESRVGRNANQIKCECMSSSYILFVCERVWSVTHSSHSFLTWEPNLRQKVAKVRDSTNKRLLKRRHPKTQDERERTRPRMQHSWKAFLSTGNKD